MHTLDQSSGDEEGRALAAHDPLLAVYTRLITLAKKARSAAAETAVSTHEVIADETETKNAPK